MDLTIIGVMIMALALVAGLICLMYFLAYAGMIFPFRGGDYRETEATLVGYVCRGLGTADNPRSTTPRLRYYNEYRGEWVEREFFNSGLPVPREHARGRRRPPNPLATGEQVKIQYTRRAARVSDPRFVTGKKYSLARVLVPVLVCAALLWVGFVVLAAGILSDNLP